MVTTAHINANIAASSDDDDDGDTVGEKTWITAENSECKQSLDLHCIDYSC